MPHKFYYSERLHGKKEFGVVLNGGSYINSDFLTIIFYKNPLHKIVRLGLITKKSVGQAVERNRAKRRLREIFRLNKDRLLKGLDIVFMLKPPIIKMSYGEIETKAMEMLAKKNLILK